MRRLIGRSVVFVLGTCLVVTALGAPSAVMQVAAADSDETGAWQKLWHPAFRPSLGGGVELRGTQWLGNRFAITGSDERGAVVWWADDGVEWERTPRSTATDHGVATSIAAGPDGYVMVGSQWTPTPRGRIWHSADGLEWDRAETKLPRDSDVSAVAALEDGTFLVYGGNGRREGCWMGSSADGGATWDFRWDGDWEPGSPGGCLTAVSRDETGLLGRIDGNISESTDGVAWHELVSSEAIGEASAQGTGLHHDLGLVPLDDGRYVLGRRDSTTITWSRDGGLELDEDLLDWTDLWRVGLAVGPERAVAVKHGMPVPLLSPPADAYTERWARRGLVCRPNNPKIEHIVAMRPRERLECYGGRELTFDAWIPHSEYGGTCPFGEPYDWMLCWNYWLATGPGNDPGFLNYGLHPDAKLDKGLDPASWGSHVRVTGHFDDPAAQQCPEPDWDEKPLEGWDSQTRADFVDDCRKQFIVTRMRRIKD